MKTSLSGLRARGRVSVLKVTPQSQVGTEFWEGRREEEDNAKARSRREEDEKDSVVTCRGMGILPMIPTGPALSGMPRGGGFFCREGYSRSQSRAREPPPRNAGQDAGATKAPLRALRTVRFQPQPLVREPLRLKAIFCCNFVRRVIYIRLLCEEGNLRQSRTGMRSTAGER